MIGNPAYNYQYNGKELQKETGWNDYGARMYMADIGNVPNMLVSIINGLGPR